MKKKGKMKKCSEVMKNIETCKKPMAFSTSAGRFLKKDPLGGRGWRGSPLRTGHLIGKVIDFLHYP